MARVCGPDGRATQSERPGAVPAREPAAAAGLGAVYVAAMGGSHPLAKRVGAWPSVVAAAVVTVAAAEVVTRVGRPPASRRSARRP
jgi:hypothetical protein